MKTTHELARELIALPDKPIKVEGWSDLEDHDVTAKMTRYDPEGTAILVQRKSVEPPPRRCIVTGCLNHTDQGTFVGELCLTCHRSLVSGEIGHTVSFLGALARRRGRRAGQGAAASGQPLRSEVEASRPSKE